MKSKWNRVWAVCLAALMLVSGLTGCQTSQTGEETELLQVKANLLAQWFEVLETYEEVYSSAFRTIEYTEAYIQDNSWDTLLKARASASAAMVELRQMELPALDLTEEELSLLLDAGIEINEIQRELETLEDWRAGMDDAFSLFCYTLEDDVFLKTNVEEVIPAMAAFYREYFMMEYQYVCNFTNYLLLQADSAGMWQLWSEQLPWMAACMDRWYEGSDELEDATGQLLDKMEGIMPKMGNFLGISEYALDIFQEAAETGDFEYLRREVNEIAGVPGYFPIPYWLPDVLYLYMIPNPDTQENRLVQADEELEEVPSTCYISCGGIPVEDVQTYEEALKQWGIETYGKWNEAKDTWTLIAKSGSSTMLIEWTQENTVLYLTEPVGCLISELYLSVMNEE